MDIICELAGLSYPDYVSGKSMVPVLQKPNKKFRSEALTQTVSNGYSIITKRYRYNIWGEGGPGMRELYDKRTDPDEMNNIAEHNKYSTIVKKLDKRIRSRIEEAHVKPEGIKVLEATR